MSEYGRDYCPKCLRNDFEISKPDTNYDGACWIECTCNWCGYEWNQVYTYEYSEDMVNGERI